MTTIKKCWTYDEVQALILAVQKNPSLYDRRNPDYNQTRAKDDIWKHISANESIHDKNADECKKKWKTLRIQQRRIIIKKIKKNERRSAIQWNCYDALKFLIPHMDWTAADDIKKDPDIDLSLLSNICKKEDHENHDDNDDECDETYENDLECESQSEDSSYTSSHIFQQMPTEESTAAQVADSTITRSEQQCTVSSTPLISNTNVNDSTKLNQYLFTYVPQANTLPSSLQIRNDQDTIVNASTTNCVTINNPHTMFAETAPSTTSTTPIDNKFQLNNRIITVPVAASPQIVNYFLMDVAMQMERLNDIAQMEMKIEIHRLLLEKLRNVNNLRQTPSICFTAPTNPH